MMDYLLSPSPDVGHHDLDNVLHRIAMAPGTAPFADELLAFVGTLSRQLLTDRAFRQHPELMAMAHWFRPANLKTLRTDFLSGQRGNRVFVRRGIVFHIAPSNVDSVFIYSWLLSLLCGNGNIARVSRRRSAQMQAFFQSTASLLRKDEFAFLRESNLVLSYDHDDAITGKLSAHCQLRVVWGGDHTVASVRAIPLPALAGELAFANRFSMAVLNSGAVQALDEASLSVLAQNFYNDAFWFNQQACSSPRVVVWTGTPQACLVARKRFWAAVVEEVSRRQPENQPAQVMDRTTTLFRIAQAHDVATAETPLGALPSRITLANLTEGDRQCHDGNGLFLELELSALQDVAGLLTSRDQTIAHFGFRRDDWLGLAQHLPAHAADRIVPIGKALAFSPVWDGVNLLQSFTREVHIEDSLPTARPAPDQ